MQLIKKHFVSIIAPLIFILYFGDIFLTGDAAATHDSIMWYGIFNYFILALSEGTLPLWDPFSFSGTNFFTNFNSLGLLDPLVLLMVPLAKYGDFSALDLFHTRQLLQLLVYYWGVYFLCFYLSRKPIPSLLCSGFVFFIIGTNSLRQNGWMVASYFPWIFLFLLKFFSGATSVRNRRLCFISICYLTGLSLNTYIPSYLFIIICLSTLYFFFHLQFRTFSKNIPKKNFLFAGKSIGKSVVFILIPFFVGFFALEGPLWTKFSIVPLLILLTLTWFLKLPYVVRILRSVGWKTGIFGASIFIVLSAPFFISLMEVLPEGSENFGYARAPVLTQTDELVHISNNVLTRPADRYQAGPHYLVRFLVPFTDYRYFMGLSFMWEINLFLGIAPLIVCFIIFRRVRSNYKGLFLFLTLSLFFLMCCPENVYESVFKYFLGYSTIRVLLNFSGFFLAVWAGLLSLCLAEMGEWIESNKPEPTSSFLWLIGLAFLHIQILYYYLTHFIVPEGDKAIDLRLDWFEENLFSHSWILWGAYLSFALFLKIRNKRVRILCCGYLVLLSSYQLADFVIKYRVFFIQPSHYISSSYVHKNRDFKYKEVRVPAVPRLGPLWSYLAPMYRTPTAGPLLANDYFITGRRIYDLIRIAPPENYRFLAGVGTRHYGFFNEYLLAHNSVEALRLVENISLKKLKTVLILEDKPGETERLVKLQGPLVFELDLTKIVMGFLGSKIMKLYDQSLDFDLSDFSSSVNHEYMELHFKGNKSVPNVTWDIEHLGYFQIMNNWKRITKINRVFFHTKLYPVFMWDQDEDSLCLTRKYVYAELPYSSDADHLGKPDSSLCDLESKDGILRISKQYWREEIEKNKALRKESYDFGSDFKYLFLSPDKVTPDKSPYARDENTQVLDFGPNHIRFKINNSKAGLFYYADSYSKHWKAWVDGESTPVLRANFNFKAVYVDEGEHIVEFRFEPGLFIFFMCAFIAVSIPGLAIPCWAFYKNFSIKTLAVKAI